MQKVTPCLWFDGQAEEAAHYYVSLLPDSRIDQVVRSPADTPSGPAGMVLVVEFTLAGNKFSGLNGGPQFPFTEAVSFQIACEDQAEVDRAGRRCRTGVLRGSAVGSRTAGDCCGRSCRSGCSNCSPMPTRSDPGRAMQAMMTMTKLNIAELERAADGG